VYLYFKHNYQGKVVGSPETPGSGSALVPLSQTEVRYCLTDD
jgi:hypothetical protein